MVEIEFDYDFISGIEKIKNFDNLVEENFKEI